MIRKAAFVLRLAMQDLRGNVGVHLVAGAIIAASFLTLGLFVLVAANLRALAEHWEDKIQITAYLDDDLKPADLKVLLGWIEARDEVSGVVYVNKDQALEDFRGMLGDDSELLAGLDQNPLPASATISLKPGARDVEKVKKLSSDLAAWPGVEEVDYGGRVLEGFATASSIAQGAVTVIGVLILVAVVFIISNTIRLTMYSRADEIGIMRLVGASNLLIRLPFILEGMLQGSLAAIAGAFLLWVLYRAGLAGVSWPGMLSGFEPVFLSGGAISLIVFGGAALGAAGSFSKVRDFMRA